MHRTAILALLTIALTASCTTVNRTAFAAATIMLACDWGQTLNMEAEGWSPQNKPGHHELNPVMGPAPSRMTIDMYFLAVIAANVVLWNVLPEKVRAIPAIGISAVQASTVRNNMRLGNPLCGLKTR